MPVLSEQVRMHEQLPHEMGMMMVVVFLMCRFTDEEMGSERIRLAQVAGERQSQN